MPLQLPIGAEHGFTGVVDLVSQKAYKYDRDGNGKGEPVDIPADLTDRVDEMRGQLVEMVAEADDALLERFFRGGRARRRGAAQGSCAAAIARRRIFPVVGRAAGLHNIGSSALLDALVDFAPAPGRAGRCRRPTTSTAPSSCRRIRRRDGGAGVQDPQRPLRRQDHHPARRERHPALRHHGDQRQPRRAGAAWAR
jgi:elongation factor G